MPQQREMLRAVFVRYCAFLEQHRYLHMSRGQWMRFCRDAQLYSDLTSASDLALVFGRLRHDAKEEGDGAGMFTFDDFLAALIEVATRASPGVDMQHAFEQLVGSHVQPLAALEGPGQQDPLGDALLRDDVLAAVTPLQRKRLQHLFSAYCRAQDPEEEAALGGAQGWAEVRNALGHLHLRSFLHLAHDFALVPRLLTSKQLTACFRWAKFGPRSSHADLQRLDFQEFVDCLGRCALVAFNYTPPEAPSPKVPFKDSYSTPAKKLWLPAITSSAPATPNTTTTSSSMAPREGLQSWPGSQRGSSSGLPEVGDSPPAAGCESVSAGSTGKAALWLSKSMDSTFSNPQKPVHLRGFTVDWLGTSHAGLPQSGALCTTSSSSHTAHDLSPMRFAQHLHDLFESVDEDKQQRFQNHVGATLRHRQEARQRHQDCTLRRQHLQHLSSQDKAQQRVFQEVSRKHPLRGTSPQRHLAEDSLLLSLRQLSAAATTC